MQDCQPTAEETDNEPAECLEIVQHLSDAIADRLDHPEVWDQVGELSEKNPRLAKGVAEILGQLLSIPQSPDALLLLSILRAMFWGYRGRLEEGLLALDEIYARHSQHLTVAGALFRLQALKHPNEPRYQLAGKYCQTPFIRVDVLENSVHQCCASWLPTSMGNLKTQSWREVWNSPNAQAVRASMHDSSYRHCNKILCPQIQGNRLTPKERLRENSQFFEKVVDEQQVEIEEGPQTVNLAYDRTCNLSCPSCRPARFSAGEKERAVFARLQDENILPMLKGADKAIVTGSGDPFASRNFRHLLQQLNRENYPSLQLQIMTNGMLLTRKEWQKFPGLPGMVRLLKVSIDAATGPTHERLRQGAKWDVMLENMKFIGELRARGDIEEYELVFVVQQENYREMGDTVDLAKQVNADAVYFSRISNWGTFSTEAFRKKCVFSHLHPEHRDFLLQMQDPRLRDPMVLIQDLEQFIGVDIPPQRAAPEEQLSAQPANDRKHLPVVA